MTGFLLAGIGHRDHKNQANYLVVDAEKTKHDDIVAAFKSFTSRDDISVILITQTVSPHTHPNARHTPRTEQRRHPLAAAKPLLLPSAPGLRDGVDDRSHAMRLMDCLSRLTCACLPSSLPPSLSWSDCRRHSLHPQRLRQGHPDRARDSVQGQAVPRGAGPDHAASAQAHGTGPLSGRGADTPQTDGWRRGATFSAHHRVAACALSM